MYIKKSVLSGLVMMIGVCVLLAAALLFCFTDIMVSRYVYFLVWMGCIGGVVVLTGRIERR